MEDLKFVFLRYRGYANLAHLGSLATRASDGRSWPTGTAYKESLSSLAWNRQLEASTQTAPNQEGRQQ